MSDQDRETPAKERRRITFKAFRHRWRLGYWAPWHVTRPWLPRPFIDGNEFHNPSWSLILPLVGAVHIWRLDYSEAPGREHIVAWNVAEGYVGLVVPGCEVCDDFVAEVEARMGEALAARKRLGIVEPK